MGSDSDRGGQLILEDLQQRARLEADSLEQADDMAALVRQAHAAGFQLAVTRERAKAPGNDLTALARQIQWARVTVDAALPLAPGPAEKPVPAGWTGDRAAMRLAAFGIVLNQLRKGALAQPAELAVLLDGRVPEPQE